jgi:hypothetical protein
MILNIIVLIPLSIRTFIFNGGLIHEQEIWSHTAIRCSERRNIMKKIVVLRILVLALAVIFLAACAGPQQVKPYELGKVAAESLLFNARVLQNKGQISAAQFDQIRTVYDQFKQAQDAAIDARKTVIAYNTADNQAKAQTAMNGVLQFSTQLISLAQGMGLMKEGQ